MMPLFAAAVHLALAADPAPTPAPAAYPNPNLLVEAAELAKPGAGEKYHLLDVRSLKAFEEGHAAGAAWVPLQAWSKAVTLGTADAAFWKRSLSEVGVTPDKPAAVYGEDARDVARIWWMLKYAGVKDARVLNGGWKAFAAAKGETKAGLTTNAAPPHDWTLVADRLATKADVQAELKAHAGTLLDARSAGEHTGEVKSAKKSGCVPGAVHLEWSDLLDPKTGKFLPPAEMAKLYKDKGVDLTKPAVTYCQSGGRAAVAAFGLELMGGTKVRNYYGSWSEWGNAADTPVETKTK